MNGTQPSAQSTIEMMSVQMELHEHYSKVVSEIARDPMSPDAAKIEHDAWVVVMKKFKAHLNPQIANYLNGQINMIMSMASNGQNGLGGNLDRKEVNPTLLYNAHIRLGDLYRLLNNIDIALNYYKMAVRIDPSRGTVYNQLALCYMKTPSKFYERCFYAVLAVDSINDSLPPNLGKANIVKTIAKHSNPVIDRFVAKFVLPPTQKTELSLPINGNDWFFLSVLSIHFDDVSSILPLLLSWLEAHINNDDPKVAYDFGLLALDTLFDYIYKDRQNEHLSSNENLSNNNAPLSSQPIDILGMETSKNQAMDNAQRVALTNNFLLRHFEPLHKTYKRLNFVKEKRKYSSARDRAILDAKLCYKLSQWSSTTK